MIHPVFKTIAFLPLFAITICATDGASFPSAGVSIPFAKDGFFHQMIDGHMVILQTYEPNASEKYSVLKIATRERGSEGIPQGLPSYERFQPEEHAAKWIDSLYVPSIISFVEKFVHDEYAARGRDKALTALAEERRFLDSPSTWVIVSAYNDLSRIYAVGRVVRRDIFDMQMDPNTLAQFLKQASEATEDDAIHAQFDQHQTTAPFDLEKHLGFRLPCVPKIWDPRRGMFLGQWAELKSLVQSKSSPAKFVPLLFYALYVNGQHILPQSDPEIDFYQSVIASAHGPGEHPLLSVSSGTAVGANHFALETDRPMVGIYEKMGFQVLPGFPNADGIYAMSATLDDFEAKAVPMLNDKGVPFAELLKNEPPGFIYPVFPVDAYQELIKRAKPPSVQVGKVKLTCAGILDHILRRNRIEIPFFQRTLEEIPSELYYQDRAR